MHPFIPVDVRDHDPVYPVASCCKKAVSYKVAEPRSYLSAIRDREVCENCPMFTDPDTLISMQADTFHADIYMDRLIDLPVTNIRKLFKLLHLYRWENERAIDSLETSLCGLCAWLAQGGHPKEPPPGGGGNPQKQWPPDPPAQSRQSPA